MPIPLKSRGCKEIHPDVSAYLGHNLSHSDQQRVQEIVDDINTGKLLVTQSWGNNYFVQVDGFSVSVHSPNENNCIELMDAGRLP